MKMDREQIVADEFKKFDLNDPNIIQIAQKIMLENRYIIICSTSFKISDIIIYVSENDEAWKDPLNLESDETMDGAWMKTLHTLKHYYTERF